LRTSGRQGESGLIDIRDLAGDGARRPAPSPGTGLGV